MALIDEVRRRVLPALTVAAVVSCGPSAPPAAAYREATAADPSLPKGGEPVSVLPSHVVSGGIGTFRATSADPGIRKSGDAAGSLPSHAAAGKSAAYVPGPAPSGAAAKP